MKNTTFMEFPWSEHEENEIYVTGDQIKECYNLIMTALLYRQKYNELVDEKNFNESIKYNLSKARVFNLFEDASSSKIFDPVARDYVMDCVRKIRDVNSKKRNTNRSIDALYDFFCGDQLRKQLFAEYLASDKKRFINFLGLFNMVEKYDLSNGCDQLTEIANSFKEYKREKVDNIKL